MGRSFSLVIQHRQDGGGRTTSPPPHPPPPRDHGPSSLFACRSGDGSGGDPSASAQWWYQLGICRGWYPNDGGEMKYVKDGLFPDLVLRVCLYFSSRFV